MQRLQNQSLLLLTIMVLLEACRADGPLEADRLTIGVEYLAGVTIQLPLPAVPRPDEHSTLAPPTIAPNGAQVQVLMMLWDPRKVPPEPTHSNPPTSGKGRPHPRGNETRGFFEGPPYVALDVYLRVTGPATAAVSDPLGNASASSADPFLLQFPLRVIAGAERTSIPCAPPEDHTEALFTFNPPEPAYPAATGRLSPGEVREGWLLCQTPSDLSDSAALVWAFSDDMEGTVSTTPAWTPLARLPAGAWHMLDEGTIIGWSANEQLSDVVESAVGPSGFPTPTSVIPNSGVEVVYHGPVWVSIGAGFSYPRVPSNPGGTPGTIFLAQPAPGDCPGAPIWYRTQGSVCQPTRQDRIIRLALQIWFPGIQYARESWDELVLNQRMGFDLYVQESLDGLFATVDGVEISAEGTWLQADLPGSNARIWAVTKFGERSTALSPAPVWEIPLYPADFGQVDSRDGVCAFHECLDPDELSLMPSARSDLQLEMPVPLLALGEPGHGVIPRSVRRIDGEILVNDNLHGQDFLPREFSDPWVLIDIATATDRPQRSFLVFPDAAGGYGVAPLEMVQYYEGSSGPLAVRYDAHAETRRAEQGFALLGTLPDGVTLEDVFLVMANTGPAWRLR